MPGMDQTGPLGEGPMSGGGFGRCNPDEGNRSFGHYGVGRGGRPRGGGRGRCFGGGRGRGFGFGRHWTESPAAPSESREELRAELRTLTEEVSRLRAELNEYKRGAES